MTIETQVYNFIFWAIFAYAVGYFVREYWNDTADQRVRN